jgi:predicted anti-sigma-YlaC factor YlaD
MLTCKQVVSLPEPLQAQTLPLRASVWLHLAMCRPCRLWRQQLRLTISTVRQLREPATDPVVLDQLISNMVSGSLPQERT